MARLAGSWTVWPLVLVLVTAAGCGGGGGQKDAGSDGKVDTSPDGAMGDAGGDAGTDTTNDTGADAAEAGSDAGSDVMSDAGSDVMADTGMVEAGTDVVGEVGGDSMVDGTDAPSDTGAPNDAGADAPGDATDGPADTGNDTPATVAMLTVSALQNSIILDRCTGLMPATLVDVPAGNHTIALTASNLSKGSVSGPNDENLPSFDDFVLVNMPIAAGDPASRRFFTLNGIGAMASFVLPAVGTLKFMFIDSDTAANTGQGTVTLDATGATATVDALTNVLPWNTGCFATPASITVTDRPHRVTLMDSTLSVGGGSHDDYVLLRLPTERPMDPQRYVVLNGVGASLDFTPYINLGLRAWFIAPSSGATGQATLVITDL